MYRKFVKNMDNPAKLNVLLKTMPNPEKLITEIGTDLGSYINKLSPDAAKRFYNGMETYINKGNIPTARAVEKQLEYFKMNAPELYTSTMNKLVKEAETVKNPMYTNFMNDEINGLGSYFSRDYASSAGLSAAKERWTNMVPVIYNEMSDMGEDVLMAAGVETKDDVNGLFYPAIKSILHIGSGGWTSNVAGKAISSNVETLRAIPVIGSAFDTAADALGANAGKEYDPNVKFTIVPDEDPRLKQQKKEKEKRIQQNKSWF
jgi:hypothetical protein